MGHLQSPLNAPLGEPSQVSLLDEEGQQSLNTKSAFGKMQTCASDIHARISKTRTTNPWNKTPTHSYFPYIVPAAPTLLRNVVHLVRTRRGKPTVHHFGASFLGGGQFLLHSFLNFHAFLVVHALWTFACALRLLWFHGPSKSKGLFIFQDLFPLMTIITFLISK